MASSQLADRVSCAVCMETFDNKNHVPKILPCQHTFCQSCITQTKNKDRFPETLKCPTCRSSHTVPKKGFTTNRAVLDIADELDKDKKTSSDLKCTKHPQKTSVMVCVDCLHGLCLTCIRTSSQTHNRHQLEELDEATSLLQRKLDDTIETKKIGLEGKKLLLGLSACSSIEMTKAEEDFKAIRDKICSEANAWANKHLSEMKVIKSSALAQEQKVQSDIAKLHQDTSNCDLGTLVSILSGFSESDDTHFASKLQEREITAKQKCKFTKEKRVLKESIKTLLDSKKSVRSKYLSQPSTTSGTELIPVSGIWNELSNLFNYQGLYDEDQEDPITPSNTASNRTKAKNAQMPKERVKLETSYASQLMMFIVVIASFESSPYFDLVLRRFTSIPLYFGTELDRYCIYLIIFIFLFVVNPILDPICLKEQTMSIEDSFKNGITYCCKFFFGFYAIIYWLGLEFAARHREFSNVDPFSKCLWYILFLFIMRQILLHNLKSLYQSCHASVLWLYHRIR